MFCFDFERCFMPRAAFLLFGLIVAATLLVAGAGVIFASWVAPAPIKKPVRLEGVWELKEVDNGGRTIGYHPQLRVSPGYALLMFAHQARYPDGRSPWKGMRWRFAGDKLTVEWLPGPGQKKPEEPLGRFTCRFDERASPRTIDLTWQPPGLEWIVREEKGQVVRGIYKKDSDTLEIVLSTDGKDRPGRFKAQRSHFRLVLRKVKG
jgi:uncharacterized protein (TIGR03067 family)